jgi:hypothetical protein
MAFRDKTHDLNLARTKQSGLPRDRRHPDQKVALAVEIDIHEQLLRHVVVACEIIAQIAHQCAQA